MKDKVLRIVAKHFLKEINEQIRICKETEMAGLLEDLPEPVKTREKERYLELIKDSKILRDYLNE